MKRIGRRDFFKVLAVSGIVPGLVISKVYGTEKIDLFKGLNRPKDPNNPTPFETKHIPYIFCPQKVNSRVPFEVTVHVGGTKTEHPSAHTHFISWIELLDGDVSILRIELTPGLAHPKISAMVSLSHSTTLKALAFCNLHGLWGYEKKIEVR